MEFIVNASIRWDNGYYYREMSFDDILIAFYSNDSDDEVDEMIMGVANLDVGELFKYTFFMNETYTFKRIK